MTGEVTMLEMVVRDDVSRMGLKRLHVMRPGPMKEREALVLAAGVVERRVTSCSGRLEGLLVYEDEDLGMWHARIYWKEIVTGGIDG